VNDIRLHLLSYILRIRPLARSESQLTSESMSPFRHVGSTPWIGDRPIKRLYLHRRAQHRKTLTYNHASSGILTRDLSVRVHQKHRLLRMHDDWDRHSSTIVPNNEQGFKRNRAAQDLGRFLLGADVVQSGECM